MFLSTDRARSIEEDLDEAVGDDGLRSSCRRRSAAFTRRRPTVEHEGADGYIAGAVSTAAAFPATCSTSGWASIWRARTRQRIGWTSQETRTWTEMDLSGQEGTPRRDRSVAVTSGGDLLRFATDEGGSLSPLADGGGAESQVRSAANVSTTSRTQKLGTLRAPVVQLLRRRGGVEYGGHRGGHQDEREVVAFIVAVGALG